MRVAFSHARRLRGELAVPGDKSISHRALILGAIAEGEQLIDGIARAADVDSTARCIEALGAGVRRSPDGSVTVTPGRCSSSPALDAGNSGTTARLLCGLSAGLGVSCTIDGDASLRRRPMRRVTDPLREMGADITMGDDGTLPARISGAPLHGIDYELPVASAQVKSALLIAGLFAEGTTTVVEPVATRDHTERMFAAMGVEVHRAGSAISIEGGQRLHGTRITVPGDFSSAAFFIAAAAGIAGSGITLRGCGLNPTRTGFLDVLAEMGAPAERRNERDASGEPVADLSVGAGRLQAVTIDDPARIASIIDEIPVIAVLATRARGTTMIRGASELRHKESDRIRATVENLRALGAEVEEFDDGLSVTGPTPLRGTGVSSFGDHRMAMAMAVAGLFADAETVIDDGSVVDVSHPGFFDDLRALIA